MTACGEDVRLADYLSAHYCVVAPAIGAAGSAFAALAWAAVLFHVMSIVASGFFIPALENIAAYLGLPEDVAGATLLAFGNGAPDVFAQIAAIRRADAEGVSLALASVLGGGLFVCAAVFPIATLVSPCEESAAASRAERRYEDLADANEGIDDAGGIDSRRLLDAETSDASDDEDESGGVSGAAGSGSLRGPVISGSNGLDPGSNGLDPGSIGERLFGPVGWFNRGGAELAPGALARDAGFYLVAVVAAFGTLAARKRTFDGLGAGALALAYGLYLAVLFLPPRVKTFVDARGEGEGGDEGFERLSGDDDGGDDRGVDERAIESPSGATKNGTSRHRGALVDAAGGSGDSVPAADARGDGGGALRRGGAPGPDPACWTTTRASTTRTPRCWIRPAVPPRPRTRGCAGAAAARGAARTAASRSGSRTSPWTPSEAKGLVRLRLVRSVRRVRRVWEKASAALFLPGAAYWAFSRHYYARPRVFWFA